MDAAEIRWALGVPMVNDDLATFTTLDAEALAILVEAARVHAEWLEQGQTATIDGEGWVEDSPLMEMVEIANVDGLWRKFPAGRYFVVPLGEETQP